MHTRTRLTKEDVRYAVYSLLSANPGDFFTVADIAQVLKLQCAINDIRRALAWYVRKNKIVRHGFWGARGVRTRRYAFLTGEERRTNQAKKRRGRRLTKRAA